jgi:hypothetical protein
MHNDTVSVRLYVWLTSETTWQVPIKFHNGWYKPTRKWDDNIKTDRNEMVSEDVDRIHLTQNREC